MSTAMFPKRRWSITVAVLVLAAAGLSGPARAATTNCDGCFAVVGSDGTLLRYRGVLYARRIDVGLYGVVFKYPVNKCAYSATNTVTAKYRSAFSVLTVFPWSGNSNLQVSSISIPDIANIDTTFSLVVAC